MFIEFLLYASDVHPRDGIADGVHSPYTEANIYLRGFFPDVDPETTKPQQTKHPLSRYAQSKQERRKKKQ